MDSMEATKVREQRACCCAQGEDKSVTARRPVVRHSALFTPPPGSAVVSIDVLRKAAAGADCQVELEVAVPGRCRRGVSSRSHVNGELLRGTGDVQQIRTGAFKDEPLLGGPVAGEVVAR